MVFRQNDYEPIRFSFAVSADDGVAWGACLGYNSTMALKTGIAEERELCSRNWTNAQFLEIILSSNCAVEVSLLRSSPPSQVSHWVQLSQAPRPALHSAGWIRNCMWCSLVPEGQIFERSLMLSWSTDYEPIRLSFAFSPYDGFTSGAPMGCKTRATEERATRFWRDYFGGRRGRGVDRAPAPAGHLRANRPVGDGRGDGGCGGGDV